MNVQAQVEEFYDVVIIGAGPVGGYLGWKFKELGHTVLIVEEHSEIGRPFQCAGLVNPGAMERVPMKNTILTPIWGARINSPNGITVDWITRKDSNLGRFAGRNLMRVLSVLL